MMNDTEDRTFTVALKSQIAVIEEARDALPDNSHLRTLCNLTADGLRCYVSPARAPLGEVEAATAVKHSNRKGRLAGTIRRTAVDPRHPTGWVFATQLSGMPLDAMLDPSRVMNAAEQLEGKDVVLTGYLAGEVNLHLVADSLEPQ